MSITMDGVELRCSFYPGGVRQKAKEEFEKIVGKKVVPVMLLHGWGKDQNRSRYDYLASYLQRLGHAVIVPDMRGHGASIHIKGVGVQIDRDKNSKLLLAAMVLSDLRAVKTFLLTKNNNAELNLDQLCVVSADHMAMVAMQWAAKEWSKGDLIGVRRGRDVKAMVFLSPSKSYKGYSVVQTLRHPIFASRVPPHIPIMMIVGENERRALQDAKIMFNQIERMRPKLDLSKYKDPTERKRKRAELGSHFLVELDTQLQGTMLAHPGLKMNVEQRIAGFIHYKCVMKADQYAWTDRRPK
ncbi:MAG: hypothetical protein IH991_03285 [Planctomycetes bacterium]|nr:hypothetical protein [Planctomycetota bacterium]